MTTKSFNCANQIGPGTDPTAFHSNGAMLFGPGTAQGFLFASIGLQATLGPGTYTLFRKASFSFDTTSNSLISNPLPMTNNLSAVQIGGITCNMPTNPNFGDTYRFIGAGGGFGQTIIQLPNVNQRIHLNGNQSSGGGALTSSGNDQAITLVCVRNSGGGALVDYVCYDLQGAWTLS